MGRLIDIDSLKGCAIIRPTTHEEIEHIRACKNLVSHDDIPTAYDVDKVVEQLMNKHCGNCRKFISKGLLDKDYCKHAKCEMHDICELVKAGGVK